VTLNLAEMSVVKSRLSVSYGANLLWLLLEAFYVHYITQTHTQHNHFMAIIWVNLC